MSGNISASAVLGFNRTGPEAADRDVNDAIHEFKIFNITIASLALCILTFTGVLCSISYHSRRRQRKQARAYETRVGRGGSEDAVDIRGVERTSSLRNPLSLLRRQDAPRDSSGIYFIYSNPAAVTEDEGAIATALSEPDRTGPPSTPPPILHDRYRNAAHSGIILDPSTFYMQL
ncbi:hypothetical protein COCON_G00035740 [Conger conger]|uniref:Uncharacterized protein n=1 Tax=Conger conger TaxID=82655 RepID=A0A9Q1E064_CONCO|nr:uncharacterized protein si:dkey-246e1.3 [Conger conger]KAJ8284724.1 hypothetical protein COCON_G00035740 [Conger conger]